MNLRELVILLLGLAMVSVVARGLIVALRARRNQIKLAIDKNIPSDVDLEALELAELPSGGARVVKRDRARSEAPQAAQGTQKDSERSVEQPGEGNNEEYNEEYSEEHSEEYSAKDGGKDSEQASAKKLRAEGEQAGRDDAQSNASSSVKADPADEAPVEARAEQAARSERQAPANTALDESEVHGEPEGPEESEGPVSSPSAVSSSHPSAAANEEGQAPGEAIAQPLNGPLDEAVSAPAPIAQASLTHAVDAPQADAETEAPGIGAQQPDQSLGFESNTRPASEAEEALAAEPNSHVTDERSVDKALGELSAAELAEAELAEGAKVPAEPSVFDEDGMEAFTLSAGDRIGGGNPGLSPARGGRNNAKRGAASESLFSSAKRGLSALMPKKDTRPVDEPEAKVDADRAPQPLDPQPPLDSVDSAVDDSGAPILDPGAEANEIGSHPLFEGYGSEPEAGDEVDDKPAGDAGAGEESAAPMTTAAQLQGDNYYSAADLFPETFDDIAAQEPASPEDAPTQGKAKSKPPSNKSLSNKSRSNKRLSKKSLGEADEPALSEQYADDSSGSVDSRGEDEAMAQPSSQELSEVLVINVMAKRGRWLTGDKLLPLLLAQGLKFGELKIFTKRVGDRQDGEAVFSVANSLKPGTFDLNEMDSFATVGVTLFLELPAPVNNLSAFDQMLQTARDLVEKLDAELRDDQRNMMTGQTIEHYRQRVRDFELRLLHARAAEG